MRRMNLLPGAAFFFCILVLIAISQGCRKHPENFSVLQVSPSTDTMGATVTITGTDFDPVTYQNTVVFYNSGQPDLLNGTATVLSASTSQLTVVVPSFARSGKIQVKVKGVTFYTANNFTVLPKFTPQSEAIGYPVTIYGPGFSTTPAANIVKFNGVSALVSSSSQFQLTAIVPAGVTAGPISITTGGQTITSTEYFIPAPVGTVTTLAGSGDAGSTDATGSAASFNQPWGICTDNTGNIYVADNGNNKIRLVTPAGKVTTFAGSGNAPDADGSLLLANIYSPSGVIIAGDTSNMYISELLGNRIRPVHSGQVSTLASLSIPYTIYFEPMGMTFDAAGNLFFTNYGYADVVEITAAGEIKILAATYSPVAGGFPAQTVTTMSQPSGTAMDKGGNLYITDAGDRRIFKITPAGTFSVFAGGGNTVAAADGPGTTANFGRPTSITFDSNDNLYVVDAQYNEIRRITPDGFVSTIAGTPGRSDSGDGTGVAAGFNNPFGIAIDKNGIIYVSETGGNKIRKIVVQ